ncbi:uncharacterized protein LOC108913655 [Anoplophora glabripennis]|uniref:uncharacterized protein LOC108913655 n=1 Tax=Anoplophora glabripennis TaxID=217634 RepID=UPI0008754119|nr:uncharacterized protein LOC108913655 [Anoplophora glabripennis]
MANENNENKEVDALTSSVNRFMPRGRNSDDLPSTDGTHNVLGEIRIISGRYSGSKNSPATSKPKKKKSSPRLQVEKSSTASGDIIKGNSTDCCRQGTTHEDVLNGEELVQNKLDELPSLEDVSENDAIISKNKGADLEPKQQDEKFSVSKSMPKSEKRKRKERLARRKIFKQISPERNKIKLMSQSKNKEQTTNVKDKTRQESDKESLVLINTEDLLPKVILTNIGKYTQKPNKDIVIDLESDVENLDVPSQAVLPTVNKTNARELQSNVSAIKKGNTEGLSPTANEENEKKDDNLSSSDGTHNVSGEIRIISGRYSSSKSSLATSVPNKKLSTRLQVEKSNSATGDIVEGNSCDHYETIQGITQNPSDLQQTTCEDFLNGEELAQNKRDKLLLLEGILDKEATILKKKGADLELKRHDEEFSVSNSSPKSKEQKREGKSAGRKIFKQISPERNKIKLMSQCKDKEQTRNVKDMTRQENDKENLVLFNTEDLFPKVILTNIGKYVEKPNKGIVIDLESEVANLDVPSQEVLPAVNEAIVSESQSNVSVIKKENAEKASPMVDEDNEKKEEEIGLNKEADARPALTLIPDQHENLEYARQLSASTVENNAGENNNDEFIQDRERDFNELRKHHNQTYLSTTLGGTKRRKLYDPNDLTYLENIELFKEKDKETHTVEPSAKPQEKSIRRKVFRKKEVHHKQHKSKKLKVVRPHTTLNVSKHRDNSKLKLTFCEVLDSFRKESKSSFLNILKSTAAGKSVKEKKKVVKASKNNSTKVAKKLRTKPKNILIRNECARDHSVSDNSSASLKLVGEHKCTDDETDLDSLCREKVPYIEPDKKINIISDIQLRPKRTLLQNKSEVQNKKMKNENNPASDIEDDFCIMSKHISNNEICNWIETGSPNYNADISERRTVLKYVYFMSKKALGNPDASQEYQDLLNVCRLLKKYV